MFQVSSLTILLLLAIDILSARNIDGMKCNCHLMLHFILTVKLVDDGVICVSHKRILQETFQFRISLVVQRLFREVNLLLTW